MKTSTKANAHNKWRGILSALGFTDGELSINHGPCPICGGVDRYRFTDYKGGGEYFCSGCGPGGGFDLLMQKNEWNFLTAAKEVDRVLGTDIKEVFQPKVDMEKRRRDLNEVWAQGTDQVLVCDYMRSRGIMIPVGDMCNLRGAHELYLRGTKSRHRGMLALMRDPRGRPVSIHRTYIDAKERKVMPPTGELKGASVRLGIDPDHTVVIGEGIETTLAGMQYYDIKSGYAAISAYGMETLQISGDVKMAIILADHDASFTGQKAAFTLARHLDSKGMDVKVVMSQYVGDDFNDIIRCARRSAILDFNN